MKNFEQWQHERRKESDKIGKVNLVIFVLGFSIYFLARYLGIFDTMSPWIPTAIIWAQVFVSMGLGVLQWRNYDREDRKEKAAMEQRWAREDMELNATILLPNER